MATLTSQTIADSYEQLLSLPNGGLNGTTLVAITDGDSDTACVLEISTTKALIKGSGNRLYFHDEGGEYISGNGSILSIVGGSEIDLTATAIDINGTGDVSGTLTVGGVLTVNNGAVFNEASADADFRVESNSNANMLFVDGGTNLVGIGTATPVASASAYQQAGLHIHQAQGGSTGSQIHLTNAATGAAAGNGVYIAMWSDDDLYITNQESDGMIKFASGGNSDVLVINDGGNVGIGTSSPDSQLEIVSAASTNCFVHIDTTTDNYDAGIQIYNSNVRKWSIYNDGTGLAGEDTLVFQDESDDLTLVINQSGQVGIGTTSPYDLLSVSSETTATGPNISITSGLIDKSDYMGGLLYRTQDGAPDTVISAIKAKEHVDNSYGLEFQTYGSAGGGGLDTVMTVLGTGNVGIGIVAPSSELDIYQDNDGATAGPVLTLSRHSDSVADADILGKIVFRGKDDAGGYEDFGYIQTTILDASNTTEDSYLEFGSQVAGTGATRMVVGYNGNVGIGTTVPPNDLSVASGDGGMIALLRDDTTIADANALGQIIFGGDDPTDGTFQQGAAIVALSAEAWASGSCGTDLLFKTVDNTTTTLDIRMVILDSGNVGIGDTSPDNKLHITDSGGGSVLTLENESSGDNVAMTFTPTVGGGATTTLAGTDTGHASGAAKFIITHNSKTVFAADSSGNVGIGTTAPSNKLTVKATTTTGTGENIVVVTNNDDTNAVILGKDASDDGYINVYHGDDSQKVLINSNGDSYFIGGEVGIGLAAPTAPLHVDQASSSGAITVLKLDQGDIDDTFIDFIGTSAADGSRSISSDTTTDSAKFGAIAIEINGVSKWIRIYDDHS